VLAYPLPKPQNDLARRDLIAQNEYCSALEFPLFEKSGRFQKVKTQSSLTQPIMFAVACQISHRSGDVSGALSDC
jgi:hypothetical protein